MDWRDRYRFFEPSRPRAAKGGVKARTQRGAFGASWWARRWIAVLESFDLGGRLGRGRSYARRGQVLDIAIEKGLVASRVQGSRPDPYAITIRVKALAAGSWKKLAAALSLEARFSAKLLAGEIPDDIEKVFECAGLSLFPQRREDLQTECSCPDWSNPCKHIAAVYYLLGEEFDRDPFLIFRLRGMAREDLVGLLGSSAPTPRRAAGPSDEEAPRNAPRPISAEPSAFWAGADLPADPVGEVQIPVEAGALPKRLGPFPFWRGGAGLLEALEPLYARASARGMDVFLGVSSAATGIGSRDDVGGAGPGGAGPGGL
jgi:uncharacterized Zn finger protein